MQLKASKYFNIFVVLVMTIDLVGAAFTALPVHNEGRTSYHCKHSKSSGIAFVLFEKEAEGETEKNEEGREKFIGVELADFSNLRVLLSNIHAPSVHVTPCEQRFSVRPLLFALHCVFII